MNASNSRRLHFAKPRPTVKPVKRLRARTRIVAQSPKRRKEQPVIAKVRAACVARDGHCWMMFNPFWGECSDTSTWAHLGEWRRSNTRGMAPEQRHHTKGSLMLCARHHRMYDAHDFDIYYETDGANGPMSVEPYVKGAAA